MTTFMSWSEMRDAARKVADDIIADARNIHGPVVWITGNNYMPAMRAIPAAKAVWDADNNEDGSLFGDFVDLVESYLQEADVMLESPEWDNALFAVDLKRWKHIEKPTGDELGDEWEAIDASDNA